MQKKFECWTCGKVFIADDSNEVSCPHCNSDNVEYASFHLPYWTKWGIAIVSIVIGIILALPLVNNHTQAPTPSPDHIIGDNPMPDIGDTIPGIKNPSTIRVVTDIVPDADGKYSFEAVVDNPPTCKYYFTLTNIETDNIVHKSDDGKFSGVPYSTFEGGSYNIQIVDKSKDTLLCVPQSISGFVKMEKIEKKMTPNELQSLILKRDESLLGVGENKYLSPVCKLHFEGLPTDEPNIPTDLAAVLAKMDYGSWKSVEVKNLEYDDTKHINSITFKVVVNNNDYDGWE